MRRFRAWAAAHPTVALFARFIAVGVLNTAFGYSCFALLLYFGLPYAVALLIATVLGVLFNFKSTGMFVFKSRDNSLIFRFVLVYGVIYGINVILLKLLMMIGLNSYQAGALCLLPMALLSFVLMRAVAFNAR